jgi:hypothetical protein
MTGKTYKQKAHFRSLFETTVKLARLGWTEGRILLFSSRSSDDDDLPRSEYGDADKDSSLKEEKRAACLERERKERNQLMIDIYVWTVENSYISLAANPIFQEGVGPCGMSFLSLKLEKE